MGDHHQPVLLLPPEHAAVQRDRRGEQPGRGERIRDDGEIDPPLLSRVVKRDANGSVSRKPASSWIPVWVTRSSCNRSAQLRSSSARRFSSVSTIRKLLTVLDRQSP